MKREQIIEILRQKLYIDEEYDTRKDKNQYWIEGIDECADAIIALPLNVPSDEEIKDYAQRNFNLPLQQLAGCGMADWKRDEIIKVQDDYIRWLKTKPLKNNIAHAGYDTKIEQLKSELQ